MKRVKALWISLVFILFLAAPAMGETETIPDNPPVSWNLAEIYPDREAWLADYDAAMEMLQGYEAFQGRLNNAQTIFDYFQFAYFGELTRLQQKLRTYAHLGNSLDPGDPQYADLQVRLDAMTAEEGRLSAFAGPEINSLLPEERERIFSDPLFDGYSYFLRSYTDPERELPGEEAQWTEAVLTRGQGYAERIYKLLRYQEMPWPEITMPDGRRTKLTDSVYYGIIWNLRYTSGFRAEAAQLYQSRWKNFADTLAALLEEKAAQEYAGAQLKHYKTTREAKMDSSGVDPEIYDLMIETARAGVTDYQRDLKIQAREKNQKVLYDYNLPVPASRFIPRAMRYPEAVREVMEALSVLGDEYLGTFRDIILSGHVDVYPARNKPAEAFEYFAGKDSLPWVMLNYSSDSPAPETIAHEMGHAVYDALAAKYQPVQNGRPTIFTHEVASTVNEILYYSYKIAHAARDDEKLLYLEYLLNLFRNNFFTQVRYAEFEDDLYRTVEGGGGLSGGLLSEKWQELSEAYYGDTVESFPDARYGWAAVQHFFYDSYYVYQYATSVCCAASIAGRILDGREGAADSYLAFLKAGRSDDPRELLKIAGVDPMAPETFRTAMDFYRSLLDEYDVLVR